MVRVVGRNLVAAVAATLLVAAACRDAQGPKPQASLLPDLPLPGLGAIVVSTVTSGSSLDPDGYTVTVDNGSSQHIATNGVVTFTGLSIGNHTVTLSGVAPNCSVNNTVTVTIPLVGSGSTTFTVNCVAAPPPSGNLTVSTSTTGSSLDPDGYTVTLDGNTNRAIPANGSVTFSGLSAGSHTVVLSGVAGNCTVSGGTSRTVNVPSGGTASTSFAVSCVAIPPPTGNLTVSTSTTGSDIDPDGYTLTLDGNTTRSIGTNGSVTFSGLSAGSHTVVLSGVAGNCTASGGTSRTVNVPAGGTATGSFTVSCAATTTTGTLTVSNSTTGSNLDPDGYTVTVSGSAGTASQTMATNGTVTFANVPPGSYQVTFSGAAANCTVTSANPQTANVAAGGTATSSFTVSCAATTTTGNLTVTTSTTGENMPAGYTLTATGPSFPTGASEPIGANATVTASGVAAGDYTVQLSDVPSNCMVSGANPRPISVPAGGTATTTFSVSCAGAPPPPAGRVTGQGQVGTAPPQPGNDAVTFNFDVRADLTGRFTGTDYQDLHAGGVPATLTTDPVSDPATSFTAFRSSSSVCADPSRGVEIDATGREDTGGVVAYTLAVCDNGPANSGMDFFSVFIPSENFRRSGQVASGDIVKS